MESYITAGLGSFTITLLLLLGIPYNIHISRDNSFDPETIVRSKRDVAEKTKFTFNDYYGDTRSETLDFSAKSLSYAWTGYGNIVEEDARNIPQANGFLEWKDDVLLSWITNYSVINCLK